MHNSPRKLALYDDPVFHAWLFVILWNTGDFTSMRQISGGMLRKISVKKRTFSADFFVYYGENSPVTGIDRRTDFPSEAIAGRGKFTPAGQKRNGSSAER